MLISNLIATYFEKNLSSDSIRYHKSKNSFQLRKGDLIYELSLTFINRHGTIIIDPYFNVYHKDVSKLTKKKLNLIGIPTTYNQRIIGNKCNVYESLRKNLDLNQYQPRIEYGTNDDISEHLHKEFEYIKNSFTSFIAEFDSAERILKSFLDKKDKFHEMHIINLSHILAHFSLALYEKYDLENLIQIFKTFITEFAHDNNLNEYLNYYNNYIN